MNEWGTYPWSDFCVPHWELISHNKWHPETSVISTPPEIASGAHFYAWHVLKTTLVKPSILLLRHEVMWQKTLQEMS